MARRKTTVTGYRAWVTERLAPLLPNGWVLVPYTRTVDAITVPTVMVKLQSITRLAAAPRAAHETTYTVTIVDPAADPGEADARLDDEIVELLHALDMTTDADGTPRLVWDSAERVVYSDTHLAFDISVKVITSATPEE